MEEWDGTAGAGHRPVPMHVAPLPPLPRRINSSNSSAGRRLGVLLLVVEGAWAMLTVTTGLAEGGACHRCCRPIIIIIITRHTRTGQRRLARRICFTITLHRCLRRAAGSCMPAAHPYKHTTRAPMRRATVPVEHRQQLLQGAVPPTRPWCRLFWGRAAWAVIAIATVIVTAPRPPLPPLLLLLVLVLVPVLVAYPASAPAAGRARYRCRRVQSRRPPPPSRGRAPWRAPTRATTSTLAPPQLQQLAVVVVAEVVELARGGRRSRHSRSHWVIPAPPTVVPAENQRLPTPCSLTARFPCQARVGTTRICSALLR